LAPGARSVICDNGLTVARLALKECVLGAIRERILVPDHVASAVERALELVAD
jgi:hypothetical protein